MIRKTTRRGKEMRCAKLIPAIRRAGRAPVNIVPLGPQKGPPHIAVTLFVVPAGHDPATP